MAGRQDSASLDAISSSFFAMNSGDRASLRRRAPSETGFFGARGARRARTAVVRRGAWVRPSVHSSTRDFARPRVRRGPLSASAAPSRTGERSSSSANVPPFFRVKDRERIGRISSTLSQVARNSAASSKIAGTEQVLDARRRIPRGQDPPSRIRRAHVSVELPIGKSAAFSLPWCHSRLATPLQIDFDIGGV